MNLNPQHLSLSFRFSWEETQLTCSSTHGILLEPSVASFGFHLSTKSAMVPQRPRQSLPRWFRPSPGIQGVDYAVMFFLCFHVFLLLKKSNSMLLFFGSRPSSLRCHEAVLHRSVAKDIFDHSREALRCLPGNRRSIRSWSCTWSCC